MKLQLDLTYSLPGEIRREFTVSAVTRAKTRNLESAFNKICKAYSDPNVYDWAGCEPVKFAQTVLN